MLRHWRTEHAVLADIDVSRGGAMRRALVAAGRALADETDDGRERADCLVLEAYPTPRPEPAGMEADRHDERHPGPQG